MPFVNEEQISVLRPYAKAIAAFIIGLAMFVLQLFIDGWSYADTIALVGWLGTTFGVYQTSNTVTKQIN